MTWTEVISTLALVVSTLAFLVSAISLWRTYASEQPTAWVEVRATETPNSWLAYIHLRSPSNRSWRPISLTVPLKKLPLTEKQDFLLADASAVAPGEQIPAERCLKMSLANRAPVRSGETGIFMVTLIRGGLSDATTTKMRFCIQSLAAKPRYKTLSIAGKLPTSGLGLAIG
jgi:uncharacterized protein with PQ loop repeat